MRKLIFIPFFIGILIGSFSCNVGDVGNVTVFPPSVAVVGNNPKMGGITLCTEWGDAAAPSLLLSNYPGDCLYVKEFTIDYDNQPSPDYITATGIIKEDVDQTGLEESSSIYVGDYTLPVSLADGITSVFFNGKFFTLANCKDKVPNFRLIYKNDEPDTNGIKNFYLLARPASSSPSDVTTIYAFDMHGFVYRQGTDTTLTILGHSESTKYKYIRANLNYLSKMPEDEGGVPEFKNVNESGKPFEIIIFY